MRDVADQVVIDYIQQITRTHILVELCVVEENMITLVIIFKDVLESSE